MNKIQKLSKYLERISPGLDASDYVDTAEELIRFARYRSITIQKYQRELTFLLGYPEHQAKRITEIVWL